VPNYKLIIEYDGRKFLGWQKQKYSKQTIQQYIEDGIEKLIKEKVKLIAAGRTDAGVSAFNQVANFKCENKIVLSNFLYPLNAILPKEICIKNIKKVNDGFHARYSAKKREYLYFMTTRKIAVHHEDFYYLKNKIDFDIAGKLIGILLKSKNFRSLCRNKVDKHNFECNLFKLEYKFSRSNDEIKFKIVSDRFLHSMIRAILGAIIDTARGKFELSEITQKIAKGEKLKTKYLPPNALFLNKIYY
jgi:tRNA pseudouridine38-40 synthase